MSNEPLKVIAGAPDRPLIIGDIDIPCYVLEDETRVLSQGGFLQAIGRARTPVKARKNDVVKLPSILAAKNLKPFVNKDLVTSSTPILFQAPSRGPVAYGHRAELLPQVCEVYLKARDADALLPSQEHIAERAEILIRGLATVGIIALVDEATGYQDIRDRRELNKYLDRFLKEERAKWAKRFSDEFYKQIFRLRGWPWRGMKVNRPQVVGHYTNDIVWDRLAPHIHEELRRRNPRTETGHRRARHHQWLTDDIGHPILQAHLNGVMALMRASLKWKDFQRSLQRAYPRFGETMPLPLDD